MSIAEPEPRGKREKSKAQNRQAILDAARRVFAQLGYDATTVRDIIRGTELASGTFYNYFKSKEEVFEALQDDGARRFRPMLRAAIEEARSFEDFIRGALLAYFRFVEAERQATGPHALVIGVIRTDTPEMQAVYDEIREQMEVFIGQGRAPPVDADYLTAASIGLAREVGVRMAMRRPADVEGAAAFCAALLLGGLAQVPRRD